MRSFGARLALSYTLVSTVTMACLVAAGFFLLKRHLVHGLDLLNAAKFEQVKASVGPDFARLPAAAVDERLRGGGARDGFDFYFEIREADGRTVFRSSNLEGQPLPESVAGAHVFQAIVPNFGELRFARFSLGEREVMVASSMASVHAVMNGYAQVSLVLVALILIASIVTGLLFSQAALRPVRAIQETANRIRADNLKERIPVGDVRDEISELARFLNEMFDRLESSFDQVRRFSAEASHELKTPLSLVRLHAEKLITDEALNADQQEAVQIQLDEITRLEQIIEDLLFLARAEAGAVRLAIRRTDPWTFLEAFAADAHALAESRGVRFAAQVESAEPAAFDPRWIRQVLLNLLTNALNVSPPGALVTLDSEMTLEGWRAAIEDEGPGIPPEQRERIFERFVRLPAAESAEVKGSGLGLTIARSIIGLHGGSIRAERGARKGGLRVVFEIPVDRRPAAEPPPDRVAPRPAAAETPMD